MKETTKEEVKRIVINKFEYLINRYNREVNKRISELNNVWFNKTMPSIDLFDSLCHSIKISFGKVYEDIIISIAKENFEILPKKVEGTLSINTLEEIRTIVDENRYDKKLNIKEEIDRIKKAQLDIKADGKNKVRKVDLVLSKDRVLYLLEIKSGGKHDMGKSQKMKDEVLTNYALGLTNNINIKSFVALTYNPQGEGEFGWGCMKNFFVSKENLLVGKDFWNFVGNDENTYNDLIKIFDTIGYGYERRLLSVINDHLVKINNPNSVKVLYR